MRKPKIYLETSAISHLAATDTPDKMNDTLKLWDLIKNGDYRAFISDHVIYELRKCYEPKRTALLNYLSSINFTVLDKTNEANLLAERYIDNGILTKKRYDDCIHLAVATINECDIIVSWNFKHMVKYKTIIGVRAVNALFGYTKPIDIVQPTILLMEAGNDL